MYKSIQLFVKMVRCLFESFKQSFYFFLLFLVFFAICRPDQIRVPFPVVYLTFAIRNLKTGLEKCHKVREFFKDYEIWCAAFDKVKLHLGF